MPTWKVAFGRTAVGSVRSDASIAQIDLRASAALHGARRSHLHQVCPAHGGVGCLDGLKQLECVDQASIGAVVDLGRESDRSVSTSSSSRNIKSAGIVPC